MPTAFVTGANRGLGLEFVKQLSARGDFVYAACRTPEKADELNELAGDQVKVVPCDVCDEASIAAAVQQVDRPIDLLINNAGIYGPQGGQQHVGVLDMAAGTQVLQTNIMGPLMLVQAIVSKLASPARHVAISSGAGQIHSKKGSHALYYCASKAGLNMICKILGDTLAERGVTTVALAPGWVKTDMGGQNAKLTPQTSISDMLRFIDDLTPQHSGGYFDHDGSRMNY